MGDVIRTLVILGVAIGLPVTAFLIGLYVICKAF